MSEPNLLTDLETLNDFDSYEECGRVYRRLKTGIEQLQSRNARLEKMLELAARDKIGFSEWEGKYGPLIGGNRIESEVYNTPLAVLEAAYTGWKERNE